MASLNSSSQSFSMGTPQHSISKSGKSVKTEISLNAIITKLDLNHYRYLKKHEKAQVIETIDAVELFTAMQDINRELGAIRLENYVLNDFLEKNDSKLLIGIKERLIAIEEAKDEMQSLSSRSTRSSRKSIASVNTAFTTYASSNSPKMAQMYTVNYRAKFEFCEKLIMNVTANIRSIQMKALSDIKTLRTRTEELRYRKEETQDTVKNFAIHFLTDKNDIAFLEVATEKQLERKLRLFINYWIKNARSLIGSIRLRTMTVQEVCHAHRYRLLTKLEETKMIEPSDFERLSIKRTELLRAIKGKQINMLGLKGLSGKTSLDVVDVRKEMRKIEEQHEITEAKILEAIKVINKLEKEALAVEESNDKEIQKFQHLQQHLQRYEAPSVNQYIEKKDELCMLEKEEKIIQRKINVLNMKLNNLQRKYSKQRESG